MKKVNKLVVFSFLLTSAMSLSSCIFNDEKMFEDEKIEEAISKLKGIDCRGRGTSCPDQLTRALENYLEK